MSGGLDAILQRRAPSRKDKFFSSPILYLAEHLYRFHRTRNRTLRAPLSVDSMASTIKVVCVSDTHNKTPPVPPGADILIHAGDISDHGMQEEVQAVIDWLNTLPHRHKVCIAGNHDSCLADDSIRDNINWGDVIYLDDNSTSLSIPGFEKEIKVYGNPMTPRFGNWKFQYPRKTGSAVWKGKIPDEVDILITHGPPRYHLELENACGCVDLLEEVYRVKPKLHVFGHIHEGHGVEEDVRFDNVQRMYEKIRGRNWRSYGIHGVWMVVVMMWYILLDLIKERVGGRKEERTTTMVNAAIMGWFRDNRTQEPVVVNLSI